MKYPTNAFYFPKDLIKSPVFKSLTKSSMLFYWELRLRCKVHRPHNKPARIKDWPIDNNGQIILTYQETKALFGFSNQTHVNSVDELFQKGLIDIPHAGGGLDGDATRYSISNRWHEWSKTNFKKLSRNQDRRRKGTARNLNPTLKK